MQGLIDVRRILEYLFGVGRESEMFDIGHETTPFLSALEESCPGPRQRSNENSETT